MNIIHKALAAEVPPLGVTAEVVHDYNVIDAFPVQLPEKTTADKTGSAGKNDLFPVLSQLRGVLSYERSSLLNILPINMTIATVMIIPIIAEAI